MAPLYGDLSPADQDRAIAPSPAGRRKVVLATSIAETSLTIEGVRIVIDSGLMRVPRFSPRSGMTRLETVRVSQASADQRRGRAGRLEPGVCYRLWPEEQQRGLLPFTPPEILDADLAPLALELALWGANDATLPWLTPPPAASLATARALLVDLGALDPSGAITPHGRAMARLGQHPRLAHLVLKGRELGQGRVAALLAAILSERDFLRLPPGQRDVDLRHRVDIALERQARRRVAADPGAGAPPDAARRGRREARRVDDRSPAGARLSRPHRPAAAGNQSLSSVGRPRGCAAGRRSDGQRGVPGGGRSRRLCPGFAHLPRGADRRWPRSKSCSPSRSSTRRRCSGASVKASCWRAAGGALARCCSRTSRWRSPDADKLKAAMIEGIRQLGLGALPWSDDLAKWRERVAFLRTQDEGWPDLSDKALLESLDTWLAPFLDGVSRRSHLARIDLTAALKTLVPWDRQRELDRLAPTHVEVPSGSRVPIDYANPAEPTLSVRLQEMFGLVDTPRVGGGKVPLTIHLLSPARRPVQVTRDLASFWANGYKSVKAELKGRYPRHYWPDDPLIAEPTARVRPRPSVRRGPRPAMTACADAPPATRSAARPASNSTRWRTCAGISTQSPGLMSSVTSPSSKRRRAAPVSSTTNSSSGWSYQKPGGLACPVETMRSMRTPLFSTRRSTCSSD